MAEAKVPDEVTIDPYKLLLYKKALRRGKEREHTLRINIIGNYAQGKTSLAKRLVGKSCEGVTSTNGIEISRYTCQTCDDGSLALTSYEDESHEFVYRVATVARSFEKIDKRKEKPITQSRDDLKHKELEQPGIENEILQHLGKESETKPSVNQTDVTSSCNDTDTAVKPLNSQISEVKEDSRMILSSGDFAAFSDVIENQSDTLPKCIDIWDFGGQYIFYATHTLFHSSRALYLLVFDLTKPLDTVVRDEEYPGETGDRNMEYFARFWMESIHAYGGPNPQVILVGTHKDKLEPCDRVVMEYFEQVRSLFDESDLIYHIQREDFAVDNLSEADPGIADLLTLISKKHRELSQPVEIPARWLQLEKALRAQDTKIISFQDVIELDKEIEYSILDEEQLKLFLYYHHEKGSLFYFDGNESSDFICLDPRFLVDAFKCIVTSEQFCLNDPDCRTDWKILTKEGRLTQKLIDKVWSNKVQHFMTHKDALLAFLIKHNIIADVVEYNVDTEEKKQKDWFIVPSLLKDHSLKKEMMCFLAGKTQSQARYSMILDSASFVHMIYHRIVAAALGVWPVVNFGRKRLLFENLCVLRIADYAGLIEQRKDSGSIELRLINLLPYQDGRQPPADEFRRFVESVVLHEFRKLKCLKDEKHQPFASAYRCNHAYHGPDGGSQLSLFKENEAIICPDNVSHDDFDYKVAKSEWFHENTTKDVYPNVQLTDKMLSQIAQNAIGTNWQLLGFQLGIKGAEIDHILEENQRTAMRIFSMLLKWKDKSAERVTLEMLVEAIRKCPCVSIYWDVIRNISDEHLRKQDKDKIGLIQPLMNQTVEINKTLTLECELTKKPNVQITWLKDNEPLNDDDRITKSSNGCHHQLVFETVTMEDAGKYTCLFDKSFTECLVKIENPGGPLKFMKELTDIEVADVPSNVTFVCELNTSETQVEWYFKNQRLLPSNKYIITDDGCVHSLKIRDVSEIDEGKYTVLANGLRSEAILYVEETEEERFLLAQHFKRQKVDQSVLDSRALGAKGSIRIDGKEYKIEDSDFERICSLGRGAYGVVEKVRHIPTDTIMAVKTITGKMSPEQLKSLLMDLDMSSKSGSCPYVVQFYGTLFSKVLYMMGYSPKKSLLTEAIAEVNNDFLEDIWICMEALDASLGILCQTVYSKGQCIPEIIIGKISYAIIEALNYVYQKLRKIHRDVKPSSILINRQGLVKVCDFQIGGFLSHPHNTTQKSGVKSYMAPERIVPAIDQKGFDPKSDVWSVGITLIELATGKFPYAYSSSSFQMLSQIIHGPAPQLPTGKFSPEFEDFIAQCVKKTVSERASYKRLLQHQFLQKAETIDINLSSYFTEVLDNVEQKTETDKT